jgi:hypothetical protein
MKGLAFGGTFSIVSTRSPDFSCPHSSISDLVVLSSHKNARSRLSDIAFLIFWRRYTPYVKSTREDEDEDEDQVFAAEPAPLEVKNTIDEQESITIKCFCGFPGDDGSTVLCEKCDTWQHIACYYKSTQYVPDVHECTDCFPRPIDPKGALDK